MEKALHLLRCIGMRSTYSGYSYLACSIAMVTENPANLRSVTKNLYCMVGEKYGVSNLCVESAIRTLIASYWNQNESRILLSVLGFPLFEKPTPREMIAILSDFLADHPEFGN